MPRPWEVLWWLVSFERAQYRHDCGLWTQHLSGKPLLGVSRYIVLPAFWVSLGFLRETARVAAVCSAMVLAKSGKYMIIIHEPSVTEEQQRRAANIPTGKMDGGMKGVRLRTLDYRRTPLASVTRVPYHGQARMTAGQVFLGLISG